jgi:hypothetical protein
VIPATIGKYSITVVFTKRSNSKVEFMIYGFKAEGKPDM